MIRKIAILIAIAVGLSSVLYAQEGVTYLEGELSVMHFDPAPGSGGEYYMLVTLIKDDGSTTELEIAPHLVRGNEGRVRVYGTYIETPQNASSRFVVSQIEVIALPIETPQRSTGTLNYLTLLCRFSDSTGNPPKQPSYFDALMGDQYPGVQHFWHEVSGGQLNVVSTTSSQWFTLSKPLSAYTMSFSQWKQSGKKHSDMAQDCADAADATVDFSPYDGINFIFDDSYANYAAGTTTPSPIVVDGVKRKMRITWNPPFSYTSRIFITHEVGHTLGLPHSSGNRDTPYDSWWDVMSTSEVGTIAFHKDLLHWIPASRKIEVNQGQSWTGHLERLNQPASLTNTMMVKIPINGSTAQFYTVETRLKIGYDDAIPGEGVLIHEVDASHSFSTSPALVVDGDSNSDVNDAGAIWLPGEVFRDTQHNISVEVISRGASSFEVRVSNAIGSGVTIPATPVPLVTPVRPATLVTPVRPATLVPAMPETSLKALDATEKDIFGQSVAISGDTVVVGAPGKSDFAGEVYTFARSGTQWSQQSGLLTFLPQPFDYSGRSVAQSDDTIVVGAPGKDDYAGGVYVFSWDGSRWNRTEFDAPADSSFGRSVAIVGDTIVVGAPDEALSSGAVYIFTRDASGTWNQTPTKLTASDAADNDSFGQSVAISGNTIVVGAPGVDKDQNTGFSGAAYVFTRDASGTWNQSVTKLTTLDIVENDSFGSSVAISGNTVVVGAPYADRSAGAAYVFSWDGTQWNQLPTKLNSSNQATSNFGESVAIAGATVVVGAPSADNFAGAAYVFALSGSQWSQKAYLKAADAAEKDHFGQSVAIAGNTVMVGAPGVDNQAGAAYVFKLLSEFSINDMQVNENDGTATFTVTRSGLITNAVSVDVITADGTAKAGEDYTALTTTLNFAINETTQTVEVRINPDTTVEPDETFFVKLSNPSAGAVIHDGEGLGTIMNDDIAPSPTPVKPTPMTPTSTPVGDAPPCSTVPSVSSRPDGVPQAPQNICVNLRQGQPRIVWSHDPKAQWFNFFIVGPDDSLVVNDQWFSISIAPLTRPELSRVHCYLETCMFDLPEAYPLIGAGEYELWMRAWGTPDGDVNKGSLSKGGTAQIDATIYEQFNRLVFNIPATQPKHPTDMTIANANKEEPSVSWQAADGVIWYQVWIGRQLDKTTYVNHHFMNWTFAGDLGCSERGSRCEVKLPVPLSDGSNRLPAGTYQVWVNSWGPAGFAENDDPKLQGWRKITEFLVEGE